LPGHLPTAKPASLVVFFERVFEELPRSGIPDPKKCLAQWVEILETNSQHLAAS
jgi:hypothetical protein